MLKIYMQGTSLSNAPVSHSVKEIEWSPLTHSLGLDIYNVLEVAVSGDELQALRNAELFPYLPDLPVIRFYGDWAKFVVGNFAQLNRQHKEK